MASVRQRCAGVLLARTSDKDSVHKLWRAFVTEKMPALGTLLLDARHAMDARDVVALVRVSNEGAKLFTPEECQRSMEAGELLLKRTRAARYQGALGHLRESIERGECEPHIFVVWPCLASLFQLSAATMLAEYLRLEWETATRDLRGLPQPVGSVAFGKVVERMLNPALKAPVVLKRKAG